MKNVHLIANKNTYANLFNGTFYRIFKQTKKLLILKEGKTIQPLLTIIKVKLKTTVGNKN